MEYAVDFCPDNPHGEDICGQICDKNFYKHVGYTEDNCCIRQYYSRATVDTIPHQITQLLMGVDPQNRPIIVPDKTICAVMSDIYDAYRPPTGDIYTRYNVPNNESDNYVQNMIDQVINVIVTDVKNNLEMEQYNATLPVWTTVPGDFNENGLRSHPIIKTRDKSAQRFQFNMNY